MRRLTLLLAASVVAGCQSPMPAPDPGKAWVDFAMPTPGGKVLMAERLDNQRMTHGRFFQVAPGSHELTVRFDFEIFGGGQGMDTDPQERLCYMTVHYDHFEAGQRYRLEGRSLAFTPSARLINGQGQIVARERRINCLP